jgi:hypothetical protein
MANVRDLKFVIGNHIKNKIAQPWEDENTRIGLVGFATLVRHVAQCPRSVDNFSD